MKRFLPIMVVTILILSLIIASTFLSFWPTFLLMGLNVGALVYLLPSFGIEHPGNIGGLAAIITVTGLVLVLLNNFRNKTEYLRFQ